MGMKSKQTVRQRTQASFCSSALDGCPGSKGSKGPAPHPTMKIPDFKSHPGGQSNLELARRSKRPDLLFLSYHIGHDVEGAITEQVKKRGSIMPERGPLFQDVHTMALEIKKTHPSQHWVFVLSCLITIVMMPVSLFLLFNQPSALRAFNLSIWITCYPFIIFHTRYHKGGDLFRGMPWLNAFLNPYLTFIDNVWAIRPLNWQNNHMGSHHLFTNDHDDYDVKNPAPMLRLHKSQPKLWFHKYQWLYAPLMFCFTVPSYRFDNLIKNDGMKQPKRWVYFFIGIFMDWVLPFLSQGWTGIAYLWSTFTLVSIYLSYTFQVSHNHENCGHDGKDDSIIGVDDWIRKQVEESVSWGGYFASVMTGGLNLQVEHHVGPSHDTTLYYFMQPKLEAICKKHGVKYNKEPSIFHAVYRYHKYLYQMGH